MTQLTTPAKRSRADGFLDRLWQEHDVLASQLAHSKTAEEEVGSDDLSLSKLSSELDRAYELFAGRIVPHIRAADDHQTALARRDYVSHPARREHEEVERATAELGNLRDRVRGGNITGARREARRLLYELHALTGPHFAFSRGPKS